MKENILFLLVDQWPYEAFSFVGNKGIRTPNIDALAKDSVVYNKAYTSCPLCSPARGALFTSRWHNQTGMIDNLEVGYSTQQDLSLDEETWVDGAVKSGYHVGYYGKWHLGADGPIKRGAHRHPEHIELKFMRTDQKNHTYERCKQDYIDQANEIGIDGNVPYYGISKVKKRNTRPFEIADYAKGFIDEYVKGTIDKPFFLTASIADPHFPHYLPQEIVDKYGDIEIEIPENIVDEYKNKPEFHKIPWWPCMDTSHLTMDEWKKVIKFAFMHRMMTDEALGEIIDSLKEHGLYDNTTIIFTSDHGDMCGAHNRFDKGPYFYEEVWRIPLVIKSDKVKPNNGFVSNLDVAATMFDMIGFTPQKEIFGTSLITEFENEYAFGMYELYNGMSFDVTDLDFHRQIMSSTENIILISFFDAYKDIIKEEVNASSSNYRPEIEHKYHQNIFNSIKEKDSDGAKKAMNSHFSIVK